MTLLCFSIDCLLCLSQKKLGYYQQKLIVQISSRVVKEFLRSSKMRACVAQCFNFFQNKKRKNDSTSRKLKKSTITLSINITAFN